MADQRRARAPRGKHMLALAWLVGPKGSEEQGDVAAPSISRSLALALLLSRPQAKPSVVTVATVSFTELTRIYHRSISKSPVPIALPCSALPPRPS